MRAMKKVVVEVTENRGKDEDVYTTEKVFIFQSNRDAKKFIRTMRDFDAVEVTEVADVVPETTTFKDALVDVLAVNFTGYDQA